MSTMTAREFNRDVSAAKRLAADGPVIVTDRGRPAFVLLTIDEYRRHAASDSVDFLAGLAMSEDDYVDDDHFVVEAVAMDVPDL